MRISEALELYWLAKSELSQHTIDDYRITLARFVAYTSDPPITAVRHHDVQRFLQHLETDLHLGKKTRSNAWTALSSLFTWAEVEFDMKHPMRGRVQRPHASRPEIVPYTQDEVRALLAACDTFQAYNPQAGSHVEAERHELLAIRDQAIVRILLDCGLRRAELVTLDVADYNARTGQLVIRHGKGDKPRTVIIGKRTRAALARYLARRGPVTPRDPLIANYHDGTRLLGDAIRQLLDRLGQRAGVPHVYPHRFRHTFAIEFLRNGGTELALQAILGHERRDTIRIYARLADVDITREHAHASPVDNWRV